MKGIKLNNYIQGIAAKYLSAVDAEPQRSNGHEINGNRIKDILEDPGEKKVQFRASFVYLDEEDKVINSVGFATWYDARYNNPRRAAEYRLYYSSNEVTEIMSEGDLCIIAKLDDSTLLFIITKPDSSIENRLTWLFGIKNEALRVFTSRTVPDINEIGFIERTILNELGIEVEIDDEDYLEILLDQFGENFPTTKLFSEFAREINKRECSPIENPDEALLLWLDQEEILFKTLERFLVDKKLKIGFDDVEEFISFSLSVQNRRKSRAGLALENHLEAIFMQNNIRFSRGCFTERKSKPDFIFPGIEEYKDSRFDPIFLSMLGVKSTCKERWRQILTEADRIERKHLFSLEAGISKFQTDEMEKNLVQLVVPEKIFDTYDVKQKTWLMDLKTFINHVKRI